MLEEEEIHWSRFLWKRLVGALRDGTTRGRVPGCEDDSQITANFKTNRLQLRARSYCKILSSEGMKFSFDILIRSNHSPLSNKYYSTRDALLNHLDGMKAQRPYLSPWNIFSMVTFTITSPAHHHYPK
jgi:hypothetical protein